MKKKSRYNINMGKEQRNNPISVDSNGEDVEDLLIPMSTDEDEEEEDDRDSHNDSD